MVFFCQQCNLFTIDKLIIKNATKNVGVHYIKKSFKDE